MSSYIEVRNVSKSFSGRAILQNISLSVEQGTTVGLVGANGSGKSVLFKIICGFEKPDQGSVYVRGRQIGKNGRDFPADMGVFINSPGFIGIYSGFQNLKFLADIQGKIGEKEIRQTMTKVGLDPDNKEKVDNYSLGMKQKLGLAQAIMEGQDILILDEPFNALDYKTYEDVKAIIRMLKAEGKTIFLTSHHYKDIEQLCDQVYSLEDCQLLPITEEIAGRDNGHGGIFGTADVDRTMQRFSAANHIFCQVRTLFYPPARAAVRPPALSGAGRSRSGPDPCMLRPGRAAQPFQSSYHG